MAITAALPAAVTIAALAIAAPALAGATPQPPTLATPGQPASLGSTDPAADPSQQAAAPAADPAGAFLFRNGRFTPLGTIPGAAAAGHVNHNNRGQVVGLYIDAAEAASVPPGQLPPIRSFVKDPHAG